MLNSQTIAAPVPLSNFLKFELNENYSRDNGVLLAGSGGPREIVVGQLLGQVTASKKIKAWDPAATDGSQTVWGASLINASADAGVDNDDGVLALRRMGIVSALAIVWPAGATDAQKTAALATLESKGIVVR
jgi:hypothetical protein